MPPLPELSMRFPSTVAAHRFVVAGSLGVAALVALSSSGASQGLPRVRPEEVGLSSSALEQIVPGLRGYVDSGKVTGLIVAIARHGKLAYLDSVGFLDRER